MIDQSAMRPRPPRRIFEVNPDFYRYADQWFLDEPRSADDAEIDARHFTEGVAYHGILPATVPIQKPGQAVNFHLGAFEMPVVSTEVAQEFDRLAASDIELYQVIVGHTAAKYFILNVVSSLDCLDESRSEFTRWTEDDGRPDRLGQYHSISKIRVNPTLTQGHHAFRIKNWPVAFLISEELRDTLTHIPRLGVVFEPAS